MLILTRRVCETICIGNDVRVTVLSIREGRVRIGIEAPKEVNIVREELLDRPRKDRDPNYCSKCTPAGLGYCRCAIASNE